MDASSAIRGSRRRAGLSQAALAARAGTSQATISAYENRVKQPSVETLERLLAVAGSTLLVTHCAQRTSPRARGELAHAGRALVEVLGLAEALPVRHEPLLRFPRLGPPPGRPA